jgi:hypothetical protein
MTLSNIIMLQEQMAVPALVRAQSIALNIDAPSHKDNAQYVGITGSREHLL